MNQKGVVVGFLITLILLIQIIMPTVKAHTGQEFTIIIRNDGIFPTNPVMIVNDTARWINVDSTENLTHRIYVDSNSDGIYKGDEDWDSGNLTNKCETDSNGTKKDENCNAEFKLPFNETFFNINYTKIIGVYAYMGIDSNGTEVFGNISVNPDIIGHITTGFQNNEIVEEKNDESKPTALLIIASISGIGAIILGIMILTGKKDNEGN